MLCVEFLARFRSFLCVNIASVFFFDRRCARSLRQKKQPTIRRYKHSCVEGWGSGVMEFPIVFFNKIMRPGPTKKSGLRRSLGRSLNASV